MRPLLHELTAWAVDNLKILAGHPSVPRSIPLIAVFTSLSPSCTPHLGELFFENLGQSRGMGSTFGLVTFIARTQALKNGDQPFGADGPAARQLLEERGFTEAVEAEGQALIDQLAEAASGSPASDAAATEAEAALWAWYREWSSIAQVVIKDKALLRSLGYRRTRRGIVEIELEAEDEAEADETIGELVEASTPAQLSAPAPANVAAASPATPQLPVSVQEEDTAAE